MNTLQYSFFTDITKRLDTNQSKVRTTVIAPTLNENSTAEFVLEYEAMGNLQSLLYSREGLEKLRHAIDEVLFRPVKIDWDSDNEGC